MVSIKDIAKKCGVSAATVSKALNGRTDISEATRDLIRKTAEEMGYTGNPLARALKTNRTYNIGILFDYAPSTGFSHEFFSVILESFRAEAEKRGYDITYINHCLNGTPSTFLGHSRYRGFDGVAIINADYSDSEIDELVHSEIPVITMDYTFDGCSAVCSDNYKGMRKLTEYICSMGHRKIGYIHGELTDVTQERISGFYRVLREHGIELPEGYVLPGRYHDIARCVELTKELLSLPERPTCIIFPDDYSYLGVQEVIKSSGLRIPEDISTAGYDGINMAKMLQLTTYAQNTELMGRKAAEKLIDRIENREADIEHIEVTGTLFKGSTVRKL